MSLRGWMIAYHVESHNILEGDLAGAVTLHEDLVDEFRAAASWQTEDEGLLRCWLESLDAAWMGGLAESRVANHPNLLMM